MIYTHNQRWYRYKRTKKARDRSSGKDQCVICGTQRSLQLHHLTYERVGRELSKDTAWLCRTHHRAFTLWYRANGGGPGMANLKRYKRLLLDKLEQSLKS